MKDGPKEKYEAPKLERIEGAAARIVGSLLNESDELKKKNAELERLSTIDILTGIANRRGFENGIHKMIASMERNRIKGINQRLTILLADIDHFKKFNDEHGHAVGDEILKRVAKDLQGRVREGDLLARWGGEELIMAFEGADKAQILGKFGEGADRDAQPAKIEITEKIGDKTYHISFSGGVAEYRPGEDYHQAIKRADNALYEAKTSGRNRILSHEE